MEPNPSYAPPLPPDGGFIYRRGDTYHTLDDDSPYVFDTMPPTARAILILRLRAHADRLEKAGPDGEMLH